MPPSYIENHHAAPSESDQLLKEELGRFPLSPVARLWQRSTELYEKLAQSPNQDKLEGIPLSFYKLPSDIKELLQPIKETFPWVKFHQTEELESPQNGPAYLSFEEWKGFYAAYFLYVLAKVREERQNLFDTATYPKKDKPLHVIFCNTEEAKKFLFPEYSGWVSSGPVMIVNVDHAYPNIYSPRMMMGHLSHELIWHILFQLRPGVLSTFLSPVSLNDKGATLSLLEADIASGRIVTEKTLEAVSWIGQRFIGTSEGDITDLTARQLKERGGIEKLHQFWQQIEDRQNGAPNIIKLFQSLDNDASFQYLILPFFLYTVIYDTLMAAGAAEGGVMPKESPSNFLINLVLKNSPTSFDEFKPDGKINFSEYYRSLPPDKIKELFLSFVETHFSYSEIAAIILNNVPEELEIAYLTIPAYEPTPTLVKLYKQHTGRDLPIFPKSASLVSSPKELPGRLLASFLKNQIRTLRRKRGR